MMTQEQRELVQAAVDGELSASERADFQALCESSAEARSLYEQLQAVTHALDSLPPLEPPANLHAAIMAKVSLPKPSPLKTWFERFSGSPLVRYGFAASAAVLVTVGVYQAGSELDTTADFSSMVGTLGKPGSVSEGALLDFHRYSVADASGQVRLLQQSGHLALEFEMRSSEPVAFSVNLPEEALQFEAFAQQNDALAMLRFEDGRLVGEAQGEQRFVVLLKTGVSEVTAESPIELSFMRQDEVLDFGVLTPGTP